ncbi:efflux transporter outer membrane subunit [Cardiobacteriaceae bacterium TAE3-ERU3]|nr:efflux transporter outer membrane subunit [Cardiobacteriaceae bacterium TAE3-ERU3]
MRLAVLPLAIFLGACSTMTPYQQPDVPFSERWIDASLSEQQGDSGVTAAALGWREYFRDPRLQAFIESALKNNHDLRKAALNTQIVQAQHGITYANLLPTVGSNGGMQRSRSARDLSPLGRSTISENYQVGLGISGYELDFFGRVQAMSEAALNRYFATREAHDAAQLSIISAVAKTYYQARIAQELMALSEKVYKSREESLRLAKLQYDAGVISAIALRGVESQIETAKADYAAQKRNAKQALNALSLLIGQPVSAMQLPPATALDEQFADIRTPANIPSAVLANRPDIREAEYQLKAANADIAAARAAFYPSITLTGNAGFASTELGNLFDGGNLMWSFAPKINLPIFDGGRRQANLKINELQQQILVEDYQQTVQSAFTDVADALFARQSLAEQYEAQQRGNHAVSERLRLENVRFENGVSSALDLLDSQRESYGSAQGLLGTKLNMLNNLVDIYIAMGGGLNEYGVQPIATTSSAAGGNSGALQGLAN